MNRNNFVLCCLAIGLLLSGASCGSLAIAEATETPEPTRTPEPNQPNPTQTPEPSPTVEPSPSPTLAPQPTSTPQPTEVPLGETARVRNQDVGIETAVTVLEVYRGEEAEPLFAEHCLANLHEQQEFLAIRARIDYLSGPENEMKKFGYLDFGVIYRDGTAAERELPRCVEPDRGFVWFESYPPGTGEGWITNKIRKGGPLPVLLYQHQLVGVVDYAPHAFDPLVLALE